MTDREAEAGRAMDALIAERLHGQTEAGNAMDAEVAHRIFGRPVIFAHSLRFEEHGWEYADVHVGSRRIPHYSGDIGAAWQVVEHLRAQGVNVEIIAYGGESLVEVEIRTLKDGRQLATGYGEGAPLAICRCALDFAARPAGGRGGCVRGGREG